MARQVMEQNARMLKGMFSILIACKFFYKTEGL